MKKKNIIIITFITLMCLAIGVGIKFYSKKDNDKKEENVKQTFSLTEEELRNYISYVPYSSEKNNAYQKYINIETIDKDLLRDTVIFQTKDYQFANNKEIKVDFHPYEDTYQESTKNYLPESYLNNILKKFYNVNPNTYQNATSIDDILTINGMSYYYENGNYILSGGGYTGILRLSKIDNYSLENDRLIIYEHAAYSIQDRDKEYIKDFNASLEIQTDNPENYFQNHQEAFNQYKHTYKKQDNAYYWYSTEIVK